MTQASSTLYMFVAFPWFSLLSFVASIDTTPAQRQSLKPTALVSTMSLIKPIGLLDLPLEIRFMIYEQLFETCSKSLDDREQRLPHPLMAVCKQLRHESQPVLMNGFQLSMCALTRRLDHYRLDHSDQLVIHPLIITERIVRAYIPGYLRSWKDFCKTDLGELVPLCRRIYIWSGYMKIGVLIIPQKNASPLIRMSDSDGSTIEGLDDLTSERVGSYMSVTNLLLKRELHKSFAAWSLLCSTSSLSVDIINQISRQLEHIVVRAARCNEIERDRRLELYLWDVFNSGLPHATLKELTLADLETIWLATTESSLHN